MRRRHIVLGATFAVLATTGGLVAAAAPASAAPSYNKYVALGDSYAAVGSLWDVSGTPGCFRSASNYAHDLAKDLGVGSLTDETCGSAVTADMTQPQNTGLGANPPQFDGLTADTNLVTVTIGGNDFGFGDIATTCATMGALSPIGDPCQQHYTVNGVDQLAASISPVAAKVGAVIQGIKQRAPQAKIVVVGYLPIMPPQNGCWPSIPIAGGDATWLYGIQRQLDAAIAAQATDNGAIGIDPSGITGHDACQLPWVRWVEPVLGLPPLHPNAAGQSNLATLIATKL
ncbi:MAG TPA: SGNH/GDSL hydrolase family protein [Pseudonocardiaceae bacterium]|jgi:lysophospholipase L1-like esterase|nr:SGNH/GDSL hydrolase family protein [Pseudonocardiaceae bacterium]